MWARKRHQQKTTVSESVSELIWRKLGLWGLPLRVIYATARSVAFGFSLLISTWVGRAIAVVVAGAMLLDASFGVDPVEIFFLRPSVFLAALVLGFFFFRRRMNWEEHVIAILYDAVPGHSAQVPVSIWFPPRPARLIQLGRWLGRYEFGFRIPGGMKKKMEAEISEHLRNRIPMTEDTSLDIKWDWRKGKARAKLVEELPETVSRPPGEISKSPERVPLGLGFGGVVYWILDSNFGNLLIAGNPGGGKSVLMNGVVRHCLEWASVFDIVCIDMKGGVELSHLPKYETVQEVAEDLDSSLELLRRIQKEVKRREKMLKATKGKAKKISDLNKMRVARGEEPLRRLMLIIDELAQLTAKPETGGNKEENDKKSECLAALDEIVRLGRAEGIHVVCALQRPDAKYTGGALRDNIQARVATGRLGRAGCEMIESDIAGELPGIAGRGLFWRGGDEEIVQFYFTEDEDLDAVFKNDEEVTA